MVSADTNSKKYYTSTKYSSRDLSNMEKALVVDDSALIRRFIKDTLIKAGYIVETANNGRECLEKVLSFQPDVVTLDVNMPVMDGIECLKQLMQTKPTPVIMCSSLTKRGAEETIKALELGAIDYLPKPNSLSSNELLETETVLLQKIKNALNSRVRYRAHSYDRNLTNQEHKIADTANLISNNNFYRVESRIADVIVVGVSTGGPSCLQEILQKLPNTFNVPIVIAQHMPARFTEVFSQRLNNICSLEVHEVTEHMLLQKGHVYVAKGDKDIKLSQQSGRYTVMPVECDTQHLWHPSVSRLVDSALATFKPNKIICVQLTGMGNDGASSMAEAKRRGAFCIAESEQTSVVYGMPKSLVELGGANISLPNDKIADYLCKLVK